MLEKKFLKGTFVIEFEANNEEVLEMATWQVTSAIEHAKRLYEETHNIKQLMLDGDVATDLDRILKKLSLKVFEIDMDKLRELDKETFSDEFISGFLMKQNNQYAIYLNKKDTMCRKRFTIAHEIGHLQLNHLADDDVATTVFRDSTTSQGTNEQEKAANAFAAELLMPEELVQFTYNLLPSVSKLARAFGVSEPAARNRLRILGIIDYD